MTGQRKCCDSEGGGRERAGSRTPGGRSLDTGQLPARSAPQLGRSPLALCPPSQGDGTQNSPPLAGAPGALRPTRPISTGRPGGQTQGLRHGRSSRATARGASAGPAHVLRPRQTVQGSWRWCSPWRSLCPSLSRRHGILHQTRCRPSCRGGGDMTRREPGLCTWLEEGCGLRQASPEGGTGRTSCGSRGRGHHAAPGSADSPPGHGLTGWTPGWSGGARRPSGGSARG